ncbi:MAG: T9SS type A sorting domain-containing protein [Ginsengibacter sp.]
MKKIISIIIFITISSGTSAQSDSNYLPVRLASFDATSYNNIAKLHWTTICYLQYANFQIQKSSDGENFMTIYSFTADKLRCRQPFDFKDSSLSNLGNVYYKINVGNIDGDFFSSAIRTVYLKEGGFDLVSVYPTMATSFLNFSLSDNKSESFWAVVINGSGAVVKKQQFKAVNGITKYTLNTNNLPAGYYWLKVLNEKGDSKTTKFFKH